MSTRKDKFTFKDKNFMKIAINLAKARRGLTGKNPSVGCLIVKNEKIISIGQTGFNGRPHAETNAINNAFENLSGSKMYVTLEPCNHYGITPPCTKKIIESGIKEIIFSINDIDKKVKGKSFKILTKKNIKVKTGLLKKEVLDLYKSYFVNRIYKLPFVTAKIAVSKNKLIYSKGTKRITNKLSDKISHYLRFKNDAIMISINTLNVDNPRLDSRLKNFKNYSLKRIILDKNLDIKFSSYIFKSSRNKNTIIFHNSNKISKEQILRKKGILLIKTKLDTEKRLNLIFVLKKIFSIGVRHLLIEGGDKLTKSLLNLRLVDEFYLFKGSKILPKSKKHLIFTSNDILKKKYNIKSKITSNLAKDNITIYKRQNV